MELYNDVNSDTFKQTQPKKPKSGGQFWIRKLGKVAAAKPTEDKSDNGKGIAGFMGMFIKQEE